MLGRIDLDQPDIVVDIPADHLRAHAIAVLELDEQLIGGRNLAVALSRVRDHVRVREDVALRRDDESGSLRLLSRLAIAAVDREDRHDPRRT